MGARAQPSLHLPISQERFGRRIGHKRFHTLLWGHWCLPLASQTTWRLLLWKQESSKWWTHPDHVYHPTTAEGEHLVDDGLSREKITRRTSRVRGKHWASAAFARLRSSLDERQISASKLRVCKQPKLEGPPQKAPSSGQLPEAQTVVALESLPAPLPSPTILKGALVATNPVKGQRRDHAVSEARPKSA